MTPGERLRRDDVGALAKLFSSLGLFALPPSCLLVLFVLLVRVSFLFIFIVSFAPASLAYLFSSSLSFPLFSPFLSLFPISNFLFWSLTFLLQPFPHLSVCFLSSSGANFTILKVTFLFTLFLFVTSELSLRSPAVLPEYSFTTLNEMDCRK